MKRIDLNIRDSDGRNDTTLSPIDGTDALRSSTEDIIPDDIGSLCFDFECFVYRSNTGVDR